MTFQPSVHGFPFPNWWPPGSPVIEIPTPFGTIPIGDAHGGVCGGMVFAAADYFHHRLPRPAEPEQPIFRYFCKRLLDSWQLPFGVLKYYDWQRRPTASRIWGGVKLVNGTAFLTATVEWPRIQAVLDSGDLAPLGLIQADGLNPRQMGYHHQVLAYGYSRHGETVTINIYDPNFPNDDLETLTLTLTNPEGDTPVVHSCTGPNVRGIFLTNYQPVCPKL